MYELTEEEREFVHRLLARGQKDLLHEIHHASSRQYRDRLRHDLALCEKLMSKLDVLAA